MSFVDSPPRPAAALRTVLKEGYSARMLWKDLCAGLVVGMVAIPLSMALAIASGAPPLHGLYTAIVAGFVAALLGGSRVQVTGPTAAFVVILNPIVGQYGMGGLILATTMAGLIISLLGLARFGRFIMFVPYPVICGFTAGIAVVIATLQIKDFLGLSTGELPHEYIQKVAVIVQALPTTSVPDLVVASITFALLFLWPKISRRFPAPLIALPMGAFAALVLTSISPDWAPASVGDRFTFDTSTNGGLLAGLPPFHLPWNWPDANGQPLSMSLALVRALLPSAFAIAILASIESLLSAVIADGMTGAKHDSDAELLGVGLGNIASSFFGGFSATGAIARTAANVRFGAVSPLSATFHSVTILVVLVGAAPLLGYLPMGSLAALLLLVAWNMAEAKHFVYVMRVAPRGDVLVLIICFLLTVVFDMVVAVTAGLMLASVLFIRRMTEVSSVRLISGEMHGAANVRPGVVVYEIAGPLFFGAAEKAMSSLSVVGGAVDTVIFDLRQVPAMDVTGLINLTSAIRKLRSKHIHVVVSGVGGRVGPVLDRAGWKGMGLDVRIEPSFEEALRKVQPQSTQTRVISAEI